VGLTYAPVRRARGPAAPHPAGLAPHRARGHADSG